MDIRSNIANCIGNYIADQTKSSKDKRERIIYGLWSFLTIVMLLITLAIIKLIAVKLFNLDIPIFTVYIAFTVLRVYLGGFHLTNTNVCFVATTILTLICSVITFYIEINLYLIITIYVIGYIVIYMVGTIDNKNKRYSTKRKVKYKKYGFILLTGLLIINILVLMNNYLVISNAIVIGMLLEISNLVLGKYTYIN